jgi:hypothetical protein
LTGDIMVFSQRTRKVEHNETDAPLTRRELEEIIGGRAELITAWRNKRYGQVQVFVDKDGLSKGLPHSYYVSGCLIELAPASKKPELRKQVMYSPMVILRGVACMDQS